ncbi:hypothetical protein RvY_12541 [Ramazzottius varieornatus]|uniref:Phospholipid/glycerol acyltransferase domain-containing protein n=1 Tax=Ramazzottius varieornatus TaxID=947166 RepID=A0A1D1VJU7_RAMVA|nr:hypothetical protein RvY_12541 [Ramazzottius varieornatus]
MPATTAGGVLLDILKYYAIFESACALFLIIEGVLNINLGVRSTYVKLLKKLFQFGSRRIEKKRAKIEKTQQPTKVWTALATSKTHVLESDEEEKPFDVPFIDLPPVTPGDFRLNSIFPVVMSGMKDIIEDEVTKAFDAEELPAWNMLTRTNKGYQHISWRLSLIWFLGFFFRHFILFPIRFMVAIFGILMLLMTAMVIARLPEGNFKVSLSRYSNTVTFRILARALSLHATYHDRENIAKRDGICVANHTSPIDVVVLSCDNVCSFVGQLHGGPFGFLQREIAKAFAHIWFDRAESKDRALVTKRMQEHVSDPTKPTILIFPEGACINNTVIMMFKKGSFELDCPIYPVAIRYNPMFGDAFWGHQPSMPAHVYDMITSWAIVCDVWYLPAMTREANEDATQFANRVRLAIAKKGGMIDIDWDPRFQAESKKPEESRWRKQQQKMLTEKLITGPKYPPAAAPTAPPPPSTVPETEHNRS